MKQTLKEYAERHDGMVDMDVTDKDIDMMVAFVYYTDDELDEPYNRFLDMVARNVEIVEEYRNGVLCCDFSGWLKPYNDQLVEAQKKYGWQNIDDEFDEDETFYDFVLWMEGLVSGYASDTTYNRLLEILDKQ